MPAYTVQCGYNRPYALMLTVEAESVFEACHRAVEEASGVDAWKGLDHVSNTYVDAIREGEDIDPWSREGSRIPVPLEHSEIAAIGGYEAARAGDLHRIVRQMLFATTGDLNEQLRSQAAQLISEIDRTNTSMGTVDRPADERPPAPDYGDQSTRDDQDQTVIATTVETNVAQSLLLKTYDNGEFASLTGEPDVLNAVKSAGDTLLTFLFRELSTQEDCHDLDTAERRLQVAIDQIDQVATALSEANRCQDKASPS